jgi:hypothetical protein
MTDVRPTPTAPRRSTVLIVAIAAPGHALSMLQGSVNFSALSHFRW